MQFDYTILTYKIIIKILRGIFVIVKYESQYFLAFSTNVKICNSSLNYILSFKFIQNYIII